MKLWNFIKENMLKYPTQTVCENEAQMTYGDLVVFAEQFAKRLKGIKCCAILCQSEMAASMSLLACFAAGVTALPLSKRYGELHCHKIIDSIRPDAVITDLDGEFDVFKISDDEYIIPIENPALIMCTSGTTGIPKGAMLTENNVITNVRDITSYFKIGWEDTILIARPLYHCAVLTGEFLTALVKGVKIRFYSGSFNPAIMLNMIKVFKITVFCGTPTLLGMMARFKSGSVEEGLCHICISGECMGKEMGERIANAFPKAKIYHAYGLTEACPRVSYLPPELFEEYGDCVGVSLRSVFFKIIKEDGNPAHINEVGILWVKGNSIMAGYYNDPNKTKEVIKDGWLCTGDLAVINEVGLLKIKGRNDDLIIKAGMNIYPQEIENALKQDPRVHDVYVYDKFDEKRGIQILMDIVGDFSTSNEVKILCSQYLPSYAVPNKINLLRKLPKNCSGKIIRR